MWKQAQYLQMKEHSVLSLQKYPSQGVRMKKKKRSRSLEQIAHTFSLFAPPPPKKMFSTSRHWTSHMHFQSGGMSTALTSQYSSFLQRLAKVHLYMADFFKTSCLCKLLCLLNTIWRIELRNGSTYPDINRWRACPYSRWAAQSGICRVNSAFSPTESFIKEKAPAFVCERSSAWPTHQRSGRFTDLD